MATLSSITIAIQFSADGHPGSPFGALCSFQQMATLSSITIALARTAPLDRPANNPDREIANVYAIAHAVAHENGNRLSPQPSHPWPRYRYKNQVCTCCYTGLPQRRTRKTCSCKLLVCCHDLVVVWRRRSGFSDLCTYLLSGSRPPDSFQLFPPSFALPSVFIFSNPFFNNP